MLSPQSRAQLAYATREGRAIVTCDVADIIELAAEAIGANTDHAGIILPATFGTDEFAAIARGITEVVRRYSGRARTDTPLAA